MQYTIQIIGVDHVIEVLRRTALNMRDARRGMSQIADYLMQITATQFDSQGRRGGGSWRRLTPEYQKRKAREGKDPRILHATGVLRKSVTKRRARGQILVINKDSLQFGSNIEYAAVHQRGGGRGIPARPYLKILPRDRTAIADILGGYIMEAWNRKSPTPIVRRR
jgi:phage virion morphogenesis protein